MKIGYEQMYKDLDIFAENFVTLTIFKQKCQNEEKQFKKKVMFGSDFIYILQFICLSKVLKYNNLINIFYYNFVNFL